MLAHAARFTRGLVAVHDRMRTRCGLSPELVPARSARALSAVSFPPAALMVCLVLSGCNGEIRSRAWAPNQLKQAMESPEGIPGVIGYLNRGAVEVDELTQLTDKDGKVIQGNCQHVTVRKLVTITDYQRPIQIWYHPGLLEANKFSAQWSGSVFTSVNSESTPDQGKTLANLGDAATKFAAIAAGFQAPARAGPGRAQKE
jgi:hypothetical protein